MSSGVATGSGTRVDVTMKLSQLQNMVKRDPAGYLDDYQAQVRRLESECGILLLSSSTERPSPQLIELMQFAAAVSSSSYKGAEADRIASLLMSLLSGQRAADDRNGVAADANAPVAALQLHRDVRKACVSALILMRNKGAVEPLKLLELFFRIMVVVPDKALRESLYSHMVHDIRNMNVKGKRNDAVNRSVQSFLHRVVVSTTPDNAAAGEEASTTSAAKMATDMVCDLYRRQVWVDERAVAIVASAVVNANTTVMCRAMRFFLNIEEKMALDKQQRQEEEWNASNHINLHKHSRKTASRRRRVAKQIKSRRKAQQKKERSEWMELEHDEGVEASKKLYPAIELLRDPQGLAEAVLKRLKSTNSSYKYEVKILMMNFVTRLVGNHQLLLLNLYPFLQRYMGGHQRDVTAVLAYAVQACHEYVPPEEVYGILKTIAHNFITERCSGEQMAVGINAARAICGRVPSALSVEESQESGSTAMDIEAFVRDLAAYSNHRDRSVSIAGKAWTNFIREVHPSLLQGKDRGLKGSALHRAGEKPLRYGQQKVAAGVEGADLLVEYESKKAAYQLRKKEDADEESDDEDDGIEAEPMNDEFEEDGLESDDEPAPDLVLLDKEDQENDEEDSKPAPTEASIDLSKMTQEERDRLKQEVSATRVFTASDFERMRKLVEREKRAKRDPREAARRKRAIAQGKKFEELSDDDADSGSESEDEKLNISGVVTPADIMAEAKRKRLSKAEKLEQIIAGRTKFESKERDGGSTNVEKKRKKNFLMSKFSHAARSKRGQKATAKTGKRNQIAGTHEAKKRRRKF